MRVASYKAQSFFCFAVELFCFLRAVCFDLFYRLRVIDFVVGQALSNNVLRLNKCISINRSKVDLEEADLEEADLEIACT